EVASSPKKKKAPHLPAGKAGNDAKRAKVIPVKKSKAVKPKKTMKEEEQASSPAKDEETGKPSSAEATAGKPEDKPANAEEAGKKEGSSGSEG
ncbi:MAG: hypothetical protein ABH838_04090, partial [Actinomycetota bacterium]